MHTFSEIHHYIILDRSNTRPRTLCIHSHSPQTDTPTDLQQNNIPTSKPSV
jgi:hypothetical protein